MTTKPSKEQYVSEATFKKESEWVHGKSDRVESAIEKLALAQLNTNERLEKIENTMATKDDVNLILNRIDHLTKKIIVFDQEEGVQSFQLVEVQRKVVDLEKRVVKLESAQ